MKERRVGHIILAKCEFCGKLNCIAHKKYVDRCEACGKRYAKYSSYKSLQRSVPTHKRQLLLNNILAEYITLKQAGYKVPRDIP